MIISDAEERGIKIISLTGRFDADYDTAEQKLASVIGACHKVIFDLKELVYINSLGLRAFLMLLKRMNKERGKLVFCNLDSNIKTVFHMTGFIHLFLVYNTLDEAVSAVLAEEE